MQYRQGQINETQRSLVSPLLLLILLLQGIKFIETYQKGKYYSGATRLAVAGIAADFAFIPVVGWGLAIGIGIADAIWGDEFYAYVENQLGN